MILIIIIVIVIIISAVFIFHNSNEVNQCGGGRTLNLEEAKLLCDADPTCTAIHETANGFTGLRKGEFSQYNMSGTRQEAVHYNQSRQRVFVNMNYTKMFSTATITGSYILLATISASNTSYTQKRMDDILISVFPTINKYKSKAICKIKNIFCMCDVSQLTNIISSSTDFIYMPKHATQSINDSSLILPSTTLYTGNTPYNSNVIYSMDDKMYTYSGDVINNINISGNNGKKYSLYYPYSYI